MQPRKKPTQSKRQTKKTGTETQQKKTQNKKIHINKFISF